MKKIFSTLLLLIIFIFITFVSTDRVASAKTIKFTNDENILTKENHPTYYGSYKKAELFWKKAKDGKVSLNGRYDDEPILSIQSLGDDDLIDGVGISFEHMTNSNDITLDKAIKISVSYLPKKIINNYYELDNTTLYKKEKDGNVYVVNYHLTDEGKTEYEKNKKYGGTICMMITSDTNNKPLYTQILFSQPKWVWRYEFNGYTKEYWDSEYVKW